MMRDAGVKFAWKLISTNDETVENLIDSKKPPSFVESLENIVTKKGPAVVIEYETLFGKMGLANLVKL
jgi:hypothetical protein